MVSTSKAPEKWAAKVPQLDLGRYARLVSEKWLRCLKNITDSGKVLNGPHKKAFEEEWAAYLGVKHVLGVASGTDALVLSLEALGVGRGDEVIIHANAFIADVEAIIALGAQPVLVDMSSEDLGPDYEALPNVVSERTKTIIAVHMLGLPCNVGKLIRFSEKYNIPLIEDASHAHGAAVQELHGVEGTGGRGKKVGSFGKINAFSCGPVKNLAALGDAGCIATDDTALYEKVKLLADHGQAKKYEHVVYGWNSRLDEVQAAWLRLGLTTLDERNLRRAAIYLRYVKALRDLEPMIDRKEGPPSDKFPVFHRAVFFSKRRDELQGFLRARGVETGIYYPHALHEQEAWKRAGLPAGSFPVAERYARQNIALPLFPEMTEEEIEYVISSVREFFRR
ncbi:MAG: DegT/DnrJ/EryC1/StrS family aminotransferase [Candidatus Sungiibacteriota bacterium]|uniref:DegT/DnrJ/EryC1/StrS family aminotransferase n=1 Tax=Candidatus Sungiibacteriota bacterium TaxID=2750080 RepID=A0A7T5RJG1_9BACT|nr:MAG: DegT/DnrJ/EryC1/StrS family aminotransferase [Candidatus Sungbacteria bacterium]